jgi:hypothetical protein
MTTIPTSIAAERSVETFRILERKPLDLARGAKFEQGDGRRTHLVMTTSLSVQQKEMVYTPWF